MRRAFRRLSRWVRWLMLPSRGVFSRFDALCFYSLTLGSCAELAVDQPLRALHSLLFAISLAGWRYMSSEPFIPAQEEPDEEERYEVDLGVPVRLWRPAVSLQVAPDERVHA